jgi:hypothetical protein
MATGLDDYLHQLNTGIKVSREPFRVELHI